MGLVNLMQEDQHGAPGGFAATMMMEDPFMSSADLRYVSDEHGERTGVIVPIALWRNMLSKLSGEGEAGRPMLEALERATIKHLSPDGPGRPEPSSVARNT